MFKQTLFAVALIATAITAQSQLDFGVWEKSPINDKFGDPTGGYVTRCFVQGTFSNTATIGSDLIVKVVLWPDGDGTIELYEYGRSPATICRGCTGLISVKMPDGSEEYVPVLSGSTGTLILNGKRSKQKALIEALRTQTGEVRVNIKGSQFYQSYDRSTYNFKIQCMGGVEPQIEEAQPADSTKTE